MYISTKDWKNFINTLSKINESAADMIEKYVQKVGLADRDALVGFAYDVVNTYGNASAAMAAKMYNEISELEGKFYEPAMLAETPDYGEVAKTVYGTLKTSENPKELGGAVSRLVKRTGQDTLLKNGMRDGAEFAWIPSGDTCAFCLTLASRGWQKISQKALRNGHAEHIHSNCDCSYMIRHSSDIDVSGYNPDKYREMYDDAEGDTPEEKINSLRRMKYAERKDVINAQKRAAYAERKTLSMKRNESTVWKGNPVSNSKEVIDDLRQFAKNKQITLDASFNSFDGDVSLVKDFVNVLDKNINGNDHVRNKRVILSVSYSLDDDTYSEVKGSNIFINGFAYRDRKLLADDYMEKVKDKWFTQGSTYMDIAEHESAHVIVYLDQLKVSGVADEVFGKNKKARAVQISNTISKYAAQNDNELIAESYVANKNAVRNESVLKVLEYCGIM